MQGGCMCGAVRYTVTGAPGGAALCHCTECRRAAGAFPVGWVTVRRDGFAWQGEPARYASSPGVERTHCARCGTSLTFAAAGEDTIDVTIGSLDAPGDVALAREIWTRERVAGLPPLPGFAQDGRQDG